MGSAAEANGNEIGRGRQAVVIGGSLAGMLAARVLSRHFARVTIVERDRLPEGPAARPGVPQANHVHGLLARGRAALEHLFPGLGDELVAAGATVMDAGAEIAWLTSSGWGVRFRSGLEMLSFTRDLLDWTLRRRLAASARIGFLEQCDVTGLVAGADGRGVAGVRLRFRNWVVDGRPREADLSTDLVVDASGRHSRAPQWLEALGYDAPDETIVNSHLGYASRLYRVPATFAADWKGLVIQAAPPRGTRAGLLIPVEGGRWMVTLGGRNRDYAPTDEAGFQAFARSLRDPALADAIGTAEPLTPIHGFRATENRRRHYERMKRWPERLIVIGDGACAFNPVYAQGMTTAALEALALDECLEEQRRRHPVGDLTGMARKFQRRLARIAGTPWALATSEDYRYPGTVGGRPSLKTRILHRYMDAVLRLATRSVKVRRRFLEVQQMLRQPPALFRPGILLRVLGDLLGERLRPVRPARDSRPRKVTGPLTKPA